MKKIKVKKVKVAEIKENELFCLVDKDEQMVVFKRLPGNGEFIKGKEYIPIRIVKPRPITKPGRFYIASDAEVLGFKAKPLELLTLLSLY